MIWSVIIVGALIGCLCGMAVYVQFQEWKDKHK